MQATLCCDAVAVTGLLTGFALFRFSLRLRRTRSIHARLGCLISSQVVQRSAAACTRRTAKELHTVWQLPPGRKKSHDKIVIRSYTIPAPLRAYLKREIRKRSPDNITTPPCNIRVTRLDPSSPAQGAKRHTQDFNLRHGHPDSPVIHVLRVESTSGGSSLRRR